MPEIDAQLEKYLCNVQIPLRLACVSENGWPVVLSLWYLYDEGNLYCATRETALVVQHLKQDERCAFEIAADLPPYCGVRGQGRAAIDPSLGVDVLKRLLDRYDIGQASPLGRRLLAHSDEEVAIVIEPINWYTWDFTERMKTSIDAPATEKLCP